MRSKKKRRSEGLEVTDIVKVREICENAALVEISSVRVKKGRNVEMDTGNLECLCQPLLGRQLRESV